MMPQSTPAEQAIHREARSWWRLTAKLREAREDDVGRGGGVPLEDHRVAKVDDPKVVCCSDRRDFNTSRWEDPRLGIRGVAAV